MSDEMKALLAERDDWMQRANAFQRTADRLVVERDALLAERDDWMQRANAFQRTADRLVVERDRVEGELASAQNVALNALADTTTLKDMIRALTSHLVGRHEQETHCAECGKLIHAAEELAAQ